MIKFIYTVCLIGLACFAFYIIVFFSFWYGSTHSSNDNTSTPECRAHFNGRISFGVSGGAQDVSTMIDSFQRVNTQYLLPDSLRNDNHIADVACCSSGPGIEIFFSKYPMEIYAIHDEGYNKGTLDFVTTFRNGKWYSSLTSKLDSSEKKRIGSRFQSELLSKLPIVRDTSSHFN